MKLERFPGPHPLCCCPEVTFSGGPTAEQIAECRRASRGITHPVITLEDMKRLQEAGLG